MNDVCPKCGLKKELCVCETIAKEEQEIRIRVVKRKFGKEITLVEGLDESYIQVKEVAKKLKSKLACGGTVKKGVIELQGNHSTKTKEALINLGFNPKAIEIG
ncbi:translation initiation factor [Candidatus Woesearchaeota archaeon]|nr:translation initiation factor [Candidatus Woesearchaeota archaeon]